MTGGAPPGRNGEKGWGDILDTLSHGVQKNDCEGEIVYSNLAHHRILGYEFGELLGHKIWDLQPTEEERASLRSYFATLKREQPEPVPFLSKSRRKDGAIVDLQVDWNYIRDGDGNLEGFISIITDITHRKKAEDSLRRRTQRLSALLEISKSFAETRELKRILQASVDGVSRIVGLDTAAIYLVEKEQLHLLATTPPLPPQFPDALRIALRSDHPHIARAINMGEPVLVPDLKRVRLTPAERTVLEIRDLRTLLYLPLIAGVETMGVLIVGSTRRPVSITEEKIDLSRTLANLSALAVKNARLYEAGQKYSAELERSLARLKRAEGERDRAIVELEEQNKELLKLNEMKNALVRDVSHELKTPVAKFAMQLDILRPIINKHRLADAEREALNVMDESLRRQEGVIKNLLDLSRLEEGGRKFKREPLRLDELITKVAEDYNHLIERHEGEVEHSLAPITIHSDGEMLWHLFSNLFSNAIKFRNKEKRLRISVRSETAGDQVVVHVADEGEGFLAEEIEHAFDRFYQSTASNEGSGVGLTICKMIAEGLGGKISIRSSGKGQGAVVSVCFPAA